MAYTTINKSSDYFNTKLWSGNGSSQALTGVGHQTDMVWIKSRTDTRKHNLYDVVRGVQKRIVPNDTVAEDTATGVTAFGTDGFTVGSETDTNGSSRNFVGWSWNANGAGSANTAGSINSTVSVNTTSGFSIVSYTGNETSGATVGHGLSAVPKVVIIKSRDSALEWRSYFSPIGAGKYMVLNQNYAETTNSNFMNDTAPTSTVFSLGNGTTPNKNGDNYIAYCFAEKQGFSKFGSYTGNGNANGTFIYTGFKPAFVMIKRTDSTANWLILDNKRDTYNPAITSLFPDTTNADATSYNTDFLSNGFKQRVTSSSRNGSGASYIYMAFAEAPLVGTNGVTAKAR